jgi:integrase
MKNNQTTANNNLLQMKLRKLGSWRTNNWRKARLDHYLEQYLIRIEPTLHPNTFRDYAHVVQNHIIPHIGMIKLKDLASDHIQMFYAFKLENGTTPTRVRFIHTILNRALNLAVKWDYIKRNPAMFVTKPKKPRKEMKTYSVGEVRSFLNVVKGSQLEALFYIAVTAGLRQGEILGLLWSDLEWDTGNLRIQRQLQRVRNEGLKFTEPKSASGRRLIVLGPTTLERLQEHKDRQDNERQGFAEEWQAFDLIFTKPNGSPIDPRGLLRNFKSIIKNAGLPDIRFHDLRHTAATMMLQCGVHPKIVQERLGHSTISITLDTYSHILPVMQIEAASKIDELLTRNVATVK